jgi:hypothetical protein
MRPQVAVEVRIISRGKNPELFPGVGWVWDSNASTVSANIWDLKGAVLLEPMIVSASGKVIGIGLLPGCGILSVRSFP